MDIKMKCTQCGCTDLEEVDFPYEAKLVMTACGIVGEATFYDLDEESYATSYICTKCGHFEFFNPKLAELIIKERNDNAKSQSEIGKIKKQILKNESEIKYIENKIKTITKQLEDLDITVRQSNDLKTMKADLTEKVQTLKEVNNSLLQQKKSLENK